MPKKQNQEVVSRDGTWIVRREGDTRSASVHRHASDAIAAARFVARNQRSSFVVHSRGGPVVESYEDAVAQED